MKYKSEDQLAEDVFNKHAPRLKEKLLMLRALVIRTAESLEGMGELEETLKWGQFSFVTHSPKTGTTIRIDAHKNNPQQYAIYFHCQTTLIETFKQMYPTQFNYSGNRALIFNLDDDLPEKQLSHCIALALTYHLNK